MPTRKQRRRRQKELRHEYEYVYVDDEGNEVEVDEGELAGKPGGPAARGDGTRPGTKAKAQASGRGKTRTGMRTVQPPSWQRVLRRAALFAPVMAVIVYLLGRNSGTAASMVVQLVVLILFFIPFSYMMDSIMYRTYRKRIGDPLPPRGGDRGTAKGTKDSGKR